MSLLQAGKPNRVLLALALVVSTGVLACSGSKPSPKQAAVPTTTVASSTVPASSGSPSTGAASITPTPSTPAISPTPAPTATAITVEAGGSASLSGLATVSIPPDGVTTATNLTLSTPTDPRANTPLKGGRAAGSAVAIDLGGQALQKPATIEVAFNPNALPAGTPTSAVFLAFYDVSKNAWVPVNGQVDTQRNVIIVQSDHFSWWKPWTWDWDAWIPVVKGTLSLDVADFVKGIKTFTDTCSESGSNASVSNTGGNNVIKACVTTDDAKSPVFRVINLKSFDISIQPGIPNSEAVVGSGESMTIQPPSTTKPPLTASASFSDEAMRRFAVDLALQMLPAGDLLKGEGVKFIAAGFDKIWSNYGISDSLTSGKPGEAATKLVQFLTDDAVIRILVDRAVTYGNQHGISAVSSWSFEGAKKVLIAVTAVDVVFSATDFISNYFLNNKSSVTLQWTPPPIPSPTATPPSSNGSGTPVEAAIAGLKSLNPGIIPLTTNTCTQQNGSCYDFRVPRIRQGTNAAVVQGALVDCSPDPTGKPQCFGGQVYAYVFSDGDGWHFVNALISQNTGFVPLPGESALITVSSGCANVRTAPNLTSQAITCLPSDTSVPLDDGPNYSDGRIWWHIKARGWTAHENFTSGMYKPTQNQNFTEKPPVAATQRASTQAASQPSSGVLGKWLIISCNDTTHNNDDCSKWSQFDYFDTGTTWEFFANNKVVFTQSGRDSAEDYQILDGTRMLVYYNGRGNSGFPFMYQRSASILTLSGSGVVLKMQMQR